MSGEIKIISNDEYHSGPGISKSGLDLVAKSPLHYWAKYLDPEREKREPTQAMIIGSAFDLIVCEPDEFSKKFFVLPDGMIRRGKAWDELEAANAGKDSLSFNEWTNINKMRNALMRQPVGRALFEKGKFQQSFFWNDPLTEELVKCRPDFLTDDLVVVDLKTATSAEFRDFQRSVVDYNYHVSSALTLDGIQQTLDLPEAEFPGPYVFCVIEKEPPFAVAIFEADSNMLFEGRAQYQDCLLKYSACRKANSWPGYPETIQTISLPKWFQRKGTT